MAESVSAFGEVGEEGACGIEAGGCGATINSERTPEISRSVSVSKSHRQETRTDLPPGEPEAEPESAREPRVPPGKKWPAKRLWKRRSLRELGNPFGIPTFPQPQQQQAISGYKSNGATWEATVTFSNGLTRPVPSVSSLLRQFIPSCHLTSCIVETNSGISIRITVPSPGRLWMSK